jgi:hypothetical protein
MRGKIVATPSSWGIKYEEAGEQKWLPLLPDTPTAGLTPDTEVEFERVHKLKEVQLIPQPRAGTWIRSRASTPGSTTPGTRSRRNTIETNIRHLVDLSMTHSPHGSG